MKKNLVLIIFLCTILASNAYSIDSYRQSVGVQKKPTQETVKTNQDKIPEGKREIKNIEEYFRYLSHEVQRNWKPYKAMIGYKVTVQFKIERDGTISDIQITDTNLRDANASVIRAVKAGVPYQPLPLSYKKNSVVAKIVLEYQRGNG